MKSLCLQIADQLEERHRNESQSLLTANALVTKLQRRLHRTEKLSVLNHYRPLAYIFQLSLPFPQLHRRIARLLLDERFNEWILLEIFARDFSWSVACQFSENFYKSNKNNTKDLVCLNVDKMIHYRPRSIVAYCMDKRDIPPVIRPYLAAHYIVSYRLCRHDRALLQRWLRDVWPLLSPAEMRSVYAQLRLVERPIALAMIADAPRMKAAVLYGEERLTAQFFAVVRQLTRRECESLLQEQVCWSKAIRTIFHYHCLVQLATTKTSSIVLQTARLTSCSKITYYVNR